MLIDTLPAAIEMDEILYELREHSAGLNCGRWDMIFSYIKTLREDPAWVMPDRCGLASLSSKPGSLACAVGCRTAVRWDILSYTKTLRDDLP